MRTKTVDDMNYEKVKVNRQMLISKKSAQDILTKKDNKVLESMPSFTIVRFLYHRHQTGLYMCLTGVFAVLAFIGYLI